MGLLALLRLLASAASCIIFILGTGLSTLGGAVAAGGPGGAGGQSSAVLDLNFADLDAATQVWRACVRVLCVVCASHLIIVVSAHRHPAHIHAFSVRADSSS